MKIGLAQMNVLPLQPERNVKNMLTYIERAKNEGIDLLTFPEMCVSGYLLGDKWTEERLVDDLQSYNYDILQATDGIAVAFGNVHVAEGFQQDGRRRKYNAVHVYQDKEPVTNHTLLPPGVQPKTLLPNYRFFDDERYFFSLQDVAKDSGVELEELLQPYVIWTKDGKNRYPIGFETCEDLWYDDYRMNGESINVTKMLIENDAEYIVNLSASPWTFEYLLLTFSYETF